MTEEAYGWSLDEITISELLWCAAYMDRIRMPPRQQASDQRSLSSSGSSDSDEATGDRIEDTGETSLPAPPPINEPRQPIYSAQPGPRSNQSNIEQRETSAGERASPVKVPDRFPLPQPAEISKSLLPFARRVSGALATELDIEATVERTAEANGLPMPVFRPPIQRWFDICLLVDQSPSMEFWGDLADGVATLFRWQGIFRDVRVWRFETNVEGSPRLLSGIDAMERRIESLITPGRARLFVVLTDTLGKAWRSGSAFEALAVLGAKHPVALAHVFPQPLWRRTALGRAIERPLAAPFPGCANDQLTVAARLRETGALYRFPVFNLSQQHLLTWAKHVAVEGEASIQGVLIRQKSLPSQPPTPEDEGDPPAAEDSPDTLVSACLQDLTPAARQLAGILAAVPLIPSVMRLAQQQFLPDTRHWHLAEVFFSGLIQRSTLGPTDAGVADAWYEFREGVREALLRHSPVRTTTEVWREIGNFIEQNADSLRDFPALVPNEDGSIAEAELDRKRYFAEVKGSVLTTWGGEFAQKGRELLAEVRAYKSDKVSQLQGDSSEDVDWTALPECEDFEYESAQIVFLPSAPTPIPITVATISIEGLPTDVPDALSGIEFVGVKHLETVRFVVDEAQNDADVASIYNQVESFPIRIATVKRQASGWEVRYEASTAQRYVETLPGDVALELVAIPAGEFRMGSPLDEPERSGYEGPQHKVTIAYGFLMGRYPITQAQWRTVASLPQVNRELDPDPSRFEGDQRPVERVSWGDAVEFCNRLNQYFNEGLSNPRDYEYRLPSEAEWEYACRANTSTPFHFGDMMTTDVANYNGASYAGGPSGARRGETTAVNRFDHANAFGLSDMHGNVREWCLDHWHGSYENALEDGSAWISSGESKNRIRRGGSWSDDPRLCRSAYRDLNSPVNRSLYLGFRVVLAPR